MTMEDKEKETLEAPAEEATATEAPAKPTGREDASASVERLTAERDEWKNRTARAVADLENYRRRAQREKEETALYANQRLVLQILPILDNLERALGSASGEGGMGLREGIELIARQFRDVLAKEGVVPIEALGQPFDPNLHHAVMQVEDDEHEEPTVVEEFQKGYRMAERVIRPSVVKVAKKA